MLANLVQPFGQAKANKSFNVKINQIMKKKFMKNFTLNHNSLIKIFETQNHTKIKIKICLISKHQVMNQPGHLK